MQKGSLGKSKRKSGKEVWEFRWRDRSGCKPVYRRIVIGATDELKSEAEARSKVVGILIEVNRVDPRMDRQRMSLAELTDHYRHRELHPDNTWKTYSTKVAYEHYLTRWVVPSGATTP